MRKNRVTSFDLPVEQVIELEPPQHDPTILPAVPPNLSFEDGAALDAARQMLTQAPALQAWCDQAFDGVNAGQALADVITLMFHQHADDGHPSGTALEDRDTVLARLELHLLLTGKAALRQSLADDAAPHTAPNEFAQLFAERDRWYLNALVCREDGEACLLSGDFLQAGADFETAARCWAHVPAHAPLAARNLRDSGRAYAQSGHPALASTQLVWASTLELAHATLLQALTQPEPAEALACLNAFSRGTFDLAGAGALNRAMELPMLAIDTNTKAAEGFTLLEMFSQAATLYNEIADIWADMADAYRQTGELANAEAPLGPSIAAARNAARLHLVTGNYEAAGHAFVKAFDYEAAATAFEAGGDHGAAGLCYQRIAQRCEADATKHRAEGLTERARADLEKALAYYTLSSHQFARAVQLHADEAQFAAAAATVQERIAALPLAMHEPRAPATQ